MDLKLSIGMQDPISAESSMVIGHHQVEVFDFIAGRFHENYPRWMTDVVELDFLDGVPVSRGSKVRQVRVENEEQITSIFEVKEFQAHDRFAFEGIDMPYRQVYTIESHGSGQTTLTFRFELLELDLFMRPFVKLIRSAMIEGVESTLQALSELMTANIPKAHSNLAGDTRHATHT